MGDKSSKASDGSQSRPQKNEQTKKNESKSDRTKSGDKKSTDKSEKPKECPICLDHISDLSRTDPCAHEFCLKCLGQWTREHNFCPVCRRVFDRIIHDIRSDTQYQVIPVNNHESRIRNALIAQRDSLRQNLTRLGTRVDQQIEDLRQRLSARERARSRINDSISRIDAIDRQNNNEIDTTLNGIRNTINEINFEGNAANASIVPIGQSLHGFPFGPVIITRPYSGPESRNDHSIHRQIDRPIQAIGGRFSSVDSEARDLFDTLDNRRVSPDSANEDVSESYTVVDNRRPVPGVIRRLTFRSPARRRRVVLHHEEPPQDFHFGNVEHNDGVVDDLFGHHMFELSPQNPFSEIESFFDNMIGEAIEGWNQAFSQPSTSSPNSESVNQSQSFADRRGTSSMDQIDDNEIHRSERNHRNHRTDYRHSRRGNRGPHRRGGHRDPPQWP